MKVMDIAVSKATQILLHANGMSAKQNNIDPRKDWSEICQDLGFTDGKDTVARRAYMDGYNGRPL
jgi:hypothetical protein